MKIGGSRSEPFKDSEFHRAQKRLRGPKTNPQFHDILWRYIAHDAIFQVAAAIFARDGRQLKIRVDLLRLATAA